MCVLRLIQLKLLTKSKRDNGEQTQITCVTFFFHSWYTFFFSLRCLSSTTSRKILSLPFQKRKKRTSLPQNYHDVKCEKMQNYILLCITYVSFSLYVFILKFKWRKKRVNIEPLFVNWYISIIVISTMGLSL